MQSERVGSSTGQDHGVVFLGNTFYSHSGCLHPGVGMGTGELSGQPDKNAGGLPVMD